MKPILTIPNNPHRTGTGRIREFNTVYSTASGIPLNSMILEPWDDRELRPAILFIQGSGWTKPYIYSKLTNLSQFVNAGYVVMTIEHRSRLEGHAFPAFLQDAKCAVRFLRANAEKYRIDPDRIAVFGTSSGGNTAMLLGLTGDDERYKTREYAEYSDSVQCVVECFGPTRCENFKAHLVDGGMCSKENMDEVLPAMSPAHIAEPGAKYPPMLLMHGDADPVVPYEDMLAFAEALDKTDTYYEAVCVHDAPHEESFWSPQVYDIIQDFIDRQLVKS